MSGMVSITSEQLEGYECLKMGKLLYDTTLEVKSAAQRVIGFSPTWTDDAVCILEVLAMRAVICGLHLDIECLNTLRCIDKAKGEYPDEVWDFFKTHKPLVAARQALTKEG